MHQRPTRAPRRRAAAFLAAGLAAGWLVAATTTLAHAAMPLHRHDASCSLCHYLRHTPALLEQCALPEPTALPLGTIPAVVVTPAGIPSRPPTARGPPRAGPLIGSLL